MERNTVCDQSESLPGKRVPNLDNMTSPEQRLDSKPRVTCWKKIQYKFSRVFERSPDCIRLQTHCRDCRNFFSPLHENLFGNKNKALLLMLNDKQYCKADHTTF